MKSQISLVLKGLCMGTADVIPGVSGGTMALILGIYERLVGSIRLIDGRMLRLALTVSGWKRLFALIVKPGLEEPLSADDHRLSAAAFLITLGVGILAAVLTGVKVIPLLMERYPAQTAGFFFGLILASIVVPYRMMEKRGLIQFATLALVAVLTYVLVGLPTSESRFATGKVVLTAEQAPAADTRIAASDTLFTAKREGAVKADGKVSSGALTFRPTSDVVWPAGQVQLEVEVVSTRTGADANIAAGTLHSTIRPLAVTATVDQPAPMTGGQETPLWYIFICGAIAICAMILPGISGSFLLLLLGEYGYVLFQVHRLVYERDMGAFVLVAVFVTGIMVGILSFSRLLNWLLINAHATTMAALIGLMAGSLRKIWPFQATTAAGYENVLPLAIDTTVIATGGMFVLGLVIVIAMTVVGARKEAQALPSGA